MVQPFDFGNVIVKENKIVEIKEKPELTFLIIAGIYLMKPSIFEFIPLKQYFGMDALMQKLLSSSETIFSYTTKEYWIDVGRVEDLDQARKDMTNQNDTR